MVRKRKIGSIKNELIEKSVESMLAAVQIFNNPNTQFKSETFIVLAVISWTYLLHAYYRSKNIEYRYFSQGLKKRVFDKTKHGAHKYWELERCLDSEHSPIDDSSASNLRFLIGLRHEIEHQMTTRIDDILSARFQACCLNFNTYLKTLFGNNLGIEKFLSFSLQFSSLSEKQVNHLSDYEDLPRNINSYVSSFDESLSDELFNDSRFSYRVLFVPKTANRKGQADKVIEFIPSDSEVAKNMNKDYVVLKDREKQKYLPSEIWKKMQEKGYTDFGVSQHTQLWKKMDAKNSGKGFGVKIAKTWYWYETWLAYVEEYCQKHFGKLD